jgi:23S rRNA pseudouridine1911/1915/1917 synthase
MTNGTETSGPECRHLVVTDADAGSRLDRFLTDRLEGLSRSRIQALVRAGSVRAAGGTLEDPGIKVKPGWTIAIAVPGPEPAAPAAEAIPLEIVYEDAHLVVIDKPAGLVVHPASGHATGTLVNALLAHCGNSLSGIGGVKRPGIVHRLDKDTSGLLVVAKSDRAHAGLSEQFAAHGLDGRMTRAYVALAWGAPPHANGRIEASLARSTKDRTRIAVTRAAGGRHAVTHYAVEACFDDPRGKPVASRLRCTLETGRTHQIRVHLAHIDHPIMADSVYGSHFASSVRRLGEAARQALADLGRHALHATHLGFVHPVTQRPLRFDSPLPPDMARLADALGTASP